MTDQKRQTLQALLVARQKLLHSFWHLIQVPLYDKGQVTDGDIANFCQDIIDYTACWHMQARLLLQPGLDAQSTCKRSQVKRDLAIQETIDVILVFDDFCTTHQIANQHQRWPALLSLLGETLAERFDLEDWLLVKSGMIKKQPIGAL